MASDDAMTIQSSMHEEYEDYDEVDDDQYHHRHRYNMSRLSVCSSNTIGDDECGGSFGKGEYDDGDSEGMLMMSHMSRLSVEEGWEGDADGELSDGKVEGLNASDESDKETTTTATSKGWLSLPATPPRAYRRRPGGATQGKGYASETEARSAGWRRRREAGRVRERWLERAWEMRKQKAMDDDAESGDSECVVIARPKGGGKSLCMDMEEVKACRDLGFDLQHHWTLEIPSRVSASTIDTDSGGNSPISTWRISSPGDDPRDVKARLKVWAQAVAIASASRLN